MSDASAQLLSIFKLDGFMRDPKEIRELIKQGANVNESDENGDTPLLLELRSITHCDGDMFEYLCKKGADIHHVNHVGQTTLMLAAANNDELLMAKLINEKVDMYASDIDGNSVVHYAGWYNKDLFRLLIKSGLSLSGRNKKNQTLLHVPISDGGAKGEMATLKWLLKQGLDPNARDSEGFTSLHAVFRMHHEHTEKFASVLIEYGADPTMLDATGEPDPFVWTEFPRR